LNEGGTGLHLCQRLGKHLGIRELYVKNEGENPTGSFKDRGMTVGVTKAVELGVKSVICASTGNTSASLAAYAAKAGLHCLSDTMMVDILEPIQSALPYRSSYQI